MAHYLGVAAESVVISSDADDDDYPLPPYVTPSHLDFKFTVSWSNKSGQQSWHAPRYVLISTAYLSE
jgi:hypothetical protein